jgi:hypothetical protein
MTYQYFCVCTILHCVYKFTLCVYNFSTLTWDLVLFFSFKNSIMYEIQLLDELVVGSFEPPDARAACDGICRHFACGSYLLKVW